MDVREGPVRPAAWRFSPGMVLSQGIGAGLFAGIIFGLVLTLISLLRGDPVLQPMQAYASIAAGSRAAESGYPASQAAVIGALVLLGISIVLGIIFMAIVALLTQFRRGMGPVVVLLGIGFGALAWAVLFRGVFVTNYPAFAELDGFWHGFVAHLFAFGLPLGWYAASLAPSLFFRRDWSGDRYRHVEVHEESTDPHHPEV